MSKFLKKINVPKLLYFVFILVSIGTMTIMPASAADIWDKAAEIMKDIYGEVVLISTVAAVVTASIALLLMNFSKSGKTVDESRAWLKRIIITWVILNSLGFIVSYLEPYLSGGKWTG